jgi:hypothetical protein
MRALFFAIVLLFVALPARAELDNSVLLHPSFIYQWNRGEGAGAAMSLMGRRAFASGHVELGVRAGTIFTDPLSLFFGLTIMGWSAPPEAPIRLGFGPRAHLVFDLSSRELDLRSDTVFLDLGGLFEAQIALGREWFVTVPIELSLMPFFSGSKPIFFGAGVGLGYRF